MISFYVKERKGNISEQENLQVIAEAYAALNAHDLDRYTALLDDSYAIVNPRIRVDEVDRNVDKSQR